MLRNYLKIAIKVLLRRKFFTFISLFAISFTLVILVVVAALFDASYGPTPPETKLGRALGVFIARMAGPQGAMTGPAGYKLLDQTVRDLPGAETATIFESWPRQIFSFRNGAKIGSYLRRTDGEYWRVLDFTFVEGGPFSPEDERNANAVAVINEATRNVFFDGGPAVGKTLELDGQRFRVVGVVPNVPLLRQTAFADVWVPISTNKSDAYRSELVGGFFALILARSTADFPAIREEFAARVARVPLPDTKEFDRLTASARTRLEWAASGFAPDDAPAAAFPVILAVALGLFLLLPTINLININMSRILERASEIGVRKAFGASSTTLVGQFVVENVVLTLLGGLLAFAFAFAVLELLNASGWLPYADFRLNPRVFAYGIASALVFGVISGVYPAWRMSRLNPVDALRGRPS
jgi:putative ABC transport system permease protein